VSGPGSSEPAQEDPPVDLRLLVPALLAWGCGAATLTLDGMIRAVLGGGLLSAAAGLVCVARRRLRTPARHARHGAGPGLAGAAMVAAACGLVTAASGLQSWSREAGLRELAQDAATVTLDAVVASDPRVLPPSGSAEPGVLIRLSVRSVQGRGEQRLVRSRVLAFADLSWQRLHWGERVVVHGRLAPARPGDDVAATVAARGPPQVTASASGPGRAVEQVRAGLRRAAVPLPADARGLLPGLVDGDTSLQPPDLDDAMRATGLTHLSAVSGTNVTIVCALALAMSRWIGLGRRTRLVAAGVVLVGFVGLARPEPSVLRAAVMGAIGLLAVGTARRRAALPALSAAVVTLLVVDPWLARSYGFALSVLATLGLLLFAGRWSRAMSRRLPGPVALALAVPLAAQVTCTPVIVLLSGQISWVAVPANLLAEPCVAPATVLGLGAALASLGSEWTAGLLAELAGVPCRVIAAVARLMARVPGGQLPWPNDARGVLSLLAVTVLALLAGPVLLRRLRASRPQGLAVLAWPAGALVTAAVVGAVAGSPLPLPGPAGWPPSGWLLVACDVGQGDALVLATGPHSAVLVDAGPDPDAVDDCLRRLQVRRLDAIVLTHFHADHVGGLPGAVRGRSVGSVLVTIVDDPPEQARRVRALAARSRIPVRTVVDGERAAVGPVSWQVLWPARVVHDGSVPNNASIVLRVQTGRLRLLLLGDVEPAAARAVATRAAASATGPQVDVMKVAHHGSAQQDAELLAQARPRLALISVGAGNDYGHPAPSLLRTLAAHGTEVARTDLQGDLAVVSQHGALALATSGPHRHAPHGQVSR
jgi:competence protein ComEC